MTGNQAMFAICIAVLFGVHGAAAGTSKTYWNHGWYKDCAKEKRRMMDEAQDHAWRWCHTRGGLDEKRTKFRYTIDKRSRTNSFCEVRGTIACND